eukprot:scaffold3827_cov179-Cylindrotheca_fusiformis.AAC.18
MGLNQPSVTEMHLPEANATACDAKSKPTLKLTARTRTVLPKSFQPLKYSVIIGKGKMPAQALGNRYLRALVGVHTHDYASAKLKREKSSIVSAIVQHIKEECPEGAFVRFDGERWWKVADGISREKVACLFRDSLSGIYKSSNKNKAQRRREKKALQRCKQAMQLERCKIVEQNRVISRPCIDQGLEQIPAIAIDGLDNMFDSVDESIFDDPLPP